MPTTVTAYLKSKQLLLFAFALHHYTSYQKNLNTTLHSCYHTICQGLFWYLELSHFWQWWIWTGWPWLCGVFTEVTEVKTQWMAHTEGRISWGYHEGEVTIFQWTWMKIHCLLFFSATYIWCWWNVYIKSILLLFADFHYWLWNHQIHVLVKNCYFHIQGLLFLIIF